jgi:glycosyltransferase involved in cell wall biosynthesis
MNPGDDSQPAASTPRVSVITPFFNTAEFLEQCIRSVLAQSYRNFEYILADNRSDDGSSQIAQRYAALDRRIRYMRFEEHLPQVENYNRAIAHMSPHAAYCKIVQADDWLFPECLARMVQLADAHPGVGVFSSFYLKGVKVFGGGGDPAVSVLDGTQVCREKLLRGGFYTGSPTAVTYRADLVRARAPFFPTGRYHEDTDVVYDLLGLSDFGFIPQVLCFQRLDARSISGSRQNVQHGALDHLIQVESYADRFLTPDEAQALRRTTRNRYFLLLGKSVIRLRGRAFWSYHFQGLRSIGWRPPLARIAVAAVAAAFGYLLNPLNTLTAIVSRAFRRAPSDPP